MDLTIVQTEPCDFIAGLESLRDALPRKLRARVTDMDLRVEAELPHLRLRLPEATEAEEAQIIAAMEGLSLPGMTLERGLPDVHIPPAPQDPEADVATIVAQLRPDLLPLAAAATPAEAVWEAVLAAKPSGVPFPEQGYTGKLAEAHDEIVRQLGGVVPWQDGGKTLAPSDLDRLKRPVRKPRIDRKAWDEVIAHLQVELRHFQRAREWFDHDGKMRNYIRDQMFSDLGFMGLLNSRYGLCDPKAEVPLSVDIAVAVITAGLGQVHWAVGKAFGILWNVARAKTGASGVVKAQIAEMEAALFVQFEATIGAVEHALVALVSDWGNLDGFCAAVIAKDIDWPDDAAPIRRAQRVGFHTACLMALMKLKSETETYRGGSSSNTWGVIQHQQFCKERKRAYDHEKGILRGPSEDAGCGDFWNDNWFFGSCFASTGGGYGPPPPTLRIAPVALASKFFLPGTDTDPGLGIKTTFFDNPKVREPWGLHTRRTKFGGPI